MNGKAKIHELLEELIEGMPRRDSLKVLKQQLRCALDMYAHDKYISDQ